MHSKGGSGQRTWAAAIEEFLVHLEAGGAAAGTIKLRRTYLNRLAASQPDLTHVTTASIERWLARPDWKPETRKSARASATTFFAWASRRGLVPGDPAEHLPPVRIPDCDPRPAPRDVVKATCQQAASTGDPRDPLMVQLALLCGLRVREVARVHSDDVEGDQLRIRGKGGRARLVPLPPVLLLALRNRKGYLFPGREDGHLSTAYVQKKIQRLMPRGWTPHTLRHAAAEAVYEESGCDLFATQAFLGHSKPETTKRYVPVNRKRMRSAVLRAAKRWPEGDATTA